MIQFNVIISKEDGWYTAECPAIPGCVSQGKTLKEAKENIKDAIQGCIEVLNKRAKRRSTRKKTLIKVVI